MLNGQIDFFFITEVVLIRLMTFAAFCGLFTLGPVDCFREFQIFITTVLSVLNVVQVCTSL